MTSAAQLLAKADRLERKLVGFEQRHVASTGASVVLLSRCSCPLCSSRKSDYDGRGAALLVRLGCPSEIPPPIELVRNDPDLVEGGGLPVAPPRHPVFNSPLAR